MIETTVEAVAQAANQRPPQRGDAPLAKRNGSRGMLPSSWMGRSVRLSYIDANGAGTDVSGTLLDWSGVGPIFNIAGARTIIAWDRLALVELAVD